MNKRILVIDDDVSMLEMILEWLVLNGYQVTTAQWVDEMIWLSDLQWRGFDCIITGINQPGLNGIEFTNLIRASGGPSVIVISGYKPDEAEIDALAASTVAFIKKPFKLEELLKIVDTCCP